MLPFRPSFCHLGHVPPLAPTNLPASIRRPNKQRISTDGHGERRMPTQSDGSHNLAIPPYFMQLQPFPSSPPNNPTSSVFRLRKPRMATDVYGSSRKLTGTIIWPFRPISIHLGFSALLFLAVAQIPSSVHANRGCRRKWTEDKIWPLRPTFFH